MFVDIDAIGIVCIVFVEIDAIRILTELLQFYFHLLIAKGGFGS